MTERRLGTVLLCHAEEPLHTEGLAAWLSRASDLRAIVEIVDPPGAWRRRLSREYKRSGVTGLADVALMRAVYAWRHARADAAWREAQLVRLRDVYGTAPADVPRLRIGNPNDGALARLLAEVQPDVMLALCKHILKPAVFGVPAVGTFVMHPGVCPEYRNAHGCFWALAEGDTGNVGMTLLKVDAGVDTGPVHGYFSYPFDEVSESHVRIQHRVVLENLPEVIDRLELVARGAAPLQVAGRASRAWGQPTFSAWLRWRRRVAS